MSELIFFLCFGSGENGREGRGCGGRGGPILSTLSRPEPTFSFRFGSVWFVERGSDELYPGRGGRGRLALSALSMSELILSELILSLRFRSGEKGRGPGGRGGSGGLILSTLSRPGPIFSFRFSCSVWFVERGSDGKDRGLGD